MNSNRWDDEYELKVLICIYSIYLMLGVYSFDMTVIAVCIGATMSWSIIWNLFLKDETE